MRIAKDNCDNCDGCAATVRGAHDAPVVVLRSFSHLFARMVGASTTVLPHGAWHHGTTNQGAWKEFVNAPKQKHQHIERDFSSTSWTAPAKTMGGANALSRLLRHTILSVSRKALARSVTSFSWVQRGVPFGLPMSIREIMLPLLSTFRGCTQPLVRQHRTTISSFATNTMKPVAPYVLCSQACH